MSEGCLERHLIASSCGTGMQVENSFLSGMRMFCVLCHCNRLPQTNTSLYCLMMIPQCSTGLRTFHVTTILSLYLKCTGKSTNFTASEATQREVVMTSPLGYQGISDRHMLQSSLVQNNCLFSPVLPHLIDGHHPPSGQEDINQVRIQPDSRYVKTPQWWQPILCCFV